MSKLKYLTLGLVLSAFLLPVGLASAQTYETYDYGDYDYEYDWSDYDYDYELTDEDAAAIAAVGTFGALFAGVSLVIFIVVGLISYVYFALTLKKTAEKLNFENTWMAWVPIANLVLIMQMGDMSPWLILLNFIPGFGSLAFLVISYIAMANVAEKVGYEKIFVLINLIPGIGTFIFWGMLAWGKKDGATPVAPQAEAVPTV